MPAMNPCSLRILSGFETGAPVRREKFHIIWAKSAARSWTGSTSAQKYRRVSFAQLHCGKKGETSAIIRKRVEKVQKIQEERYKDEKISFNGQLRSSLIDKYCPLTDSASKLLAESV